MSAYEESIDTKTNFYLECGNAGVLARLCAEKDEQIRQLRELIELIKFQSRVDKHEATHIKTTEFSGKSSKQGSGG